MQEQDSNLNSRRSMILGLGAAMTGAALITPVVANAQQNAAAFRPARHAADAWLNELPGRHRIFIDSGTARGGAEALLYANNLNNATQSAYAGEDASLAMVVCFRHFSTPFAFNDSIWEKYGEIFNSVMQMPDPNTGAAPRKNLMQSGEYGTALPNFGTTIDQVQGMGVQIAICDAATQFLSTQIAGATGAQMSVVYDELHANTVGGRFVSAGVMALTRSQEYGYSVLIAG